MLQLQGATGEPDAVPPRCAARTPPRCAARSQGARGASGQAARAGLERCCCHCWCLPSSNFLSTASKHQGPAPPLRLQVEELLAAGEALSLAGTAVTFTPLGSEVYVEVEVVGAEVANASAGVNTTTRGHFLVPVGIPVGEVRGLLLQAGRQAAGAAGGGSFGRSLSTGGGGQEASCTGRSRKERLSSVQGKPSLGAEHLCAWHLHLALHLTSHRCTELQRGTVHASRRPMLPCEQGLAYLMRPLPELPRLEPAGDVSDGRSLMEPAAAGLVRGSRSTRIYLLNGLDVPVRPAVPTLCALLPLSQSAR